MTKKEKVKYNFRGIVTYLKERPEVMVYFYKPYQRAEFGNMRVHLNATHIGIRKTMKVVNAYKKYGIINLVSNDTGEILFMIG